MGSNKKLVSIREVKRLSETRNRLIEYLRNTGFDISQFEKTPVISKLINQNKPYKNILKSNKK